MRQIVFAVVTAAAFCSPIPAMAQGLHFGWERRSWDNPGLHPRLIRFDECPVSRISGGTALDRKTKPRVPSVEQHAGQFPHSLCREKWGARHDFSASGRARSSYHNG